MMEHVFNVRLASYEVLNGRYEWFPIAWCNEVSLDTHQSEGFGFGFFCLGEMEVHFIPIKISVVGCTDTLIETESPVRHNTSL